VRSLRGAVAVVTGAGSGIGRALAHALAARGADLAIADIDERRLAETRASLPPRVAVLARAFDVSSFEAMRDFRDETEREFGRVSLLINNAGVSLYGSFLEVSLEDLEWIMGVNFWGTVYGCRLFLPLLEREPAANVVTLSSVFGIISPPMQIGYSASKFAVRGFSEVLRHELAGTHVKVTVVHPGGIRTNIASSARRGANADAAGYERDTKAFEAALVLAPEEAARRIVHAILHDRPRLLIGRDAALLDLVQRAFPARYMELLQPLLDPKRRFARTAVERV
jgi:NAD(P)-dependent dehydrogenase (short-subunit alcohol dehydrogenase family)